VLVLTYNVNSIGARLPRLLAMLADHRPDIVLLQETKTTPEAFPHLPLLGAGYVAAEHSGGRWSGVAILAREELGIAEIRRGLPGEPDATQARWVEATVGDVTVASVYVPNGRHLGSPEFEVKLQFLEAMAVRAARLAPAAAVIGGDVNVCPTDLDVWDVRLVHGATHVTADERGRLAAILDTGFVDAFRTLDPATPGFTWWDYRAGHFHKGFGLRIDLVMVSHPLAAGLTEAWVDRAYRKAATVPESKPSDHAPLLVRLG
jgi:exodeoxyribonuclease-3